MKLCPFLAAGAAVLAAISCTAADPDRPGSGETGVWTLQPEVPAFSAPSAAGNGEELTCLDAYVFRDGVLAEVHPGLERSGNGYALTLSALSGRMYVLANARGAVDPESLPADGVAEQAWRDQVVSAENGVSVYLTGVLDLDDPALVPASVHTLPVVLTRGVARFDLAVQSDTPLAVNSLVFRGLHREAYLFPQDPARTPEGSPVTELAVDFPEPEGQGKTGVAYVYEQAGGGLSVSVNYTLGGKTFEQEAALPEVLKRNTAYAVVVKQNVFTAEVTVEVLPWDREEDNGMVPDFGPIRVRAEESVLSEGAVLSEDGRTLVLPHTDADCLLTIDCPEELEWVAVPEAGITVEAVSGADGVAGVRADGISGVRGTGMADVRADRVNRFRIRKEWWRIGVAGRTVPLQFRRKALANVYPDDCITVVLTANPTVLSGMLDYTGGYAYDFGRYVDNELGVMQLPEGKRVTVEFAEGEDPWIRLDPAEDGTISIQAGWKPNDPTADGRRQTATLVICNVADGSQREEYTVTRRNWGLPVTRLNGIWWCKYNAMGNSREFGDQILSSADPAVLAGKTLYEYLQTCTPQEYFDLWKWEYQGDSGIGLEVKDFDGVAKLDGFRGDISVHMNTLDPRQLAPDGYEVPSFEDFGRIFETTGDYVWIMWDGSHISPWNGGTNIQRRNKRRNDVTVGSIALEDLFFMAMYRGGNPADFPEEAGYEPLVWYGAGAQWNDSGVKHGHYNNILFTVYSPERKGWYFNGSMSAFHLAKNGAGTKDTRILRFKKSEVRYIYGV